MDEDDGDVNINIGNNSTKRYYFLSNTHVLFYLFLFFFLDEYFE